MGHRRKLTVAAGAAHELGTPLSTIAVASRELERYVSGMPRAADLREDARLIRSEVERCQIILQRMGTDGAEPLGESLQTIALDRLLVETIRQLPKAAQTRVQVKAVNQTTSACLPARATAQSLLALLQNALDATTTVDPVYVGACCSARMLILRVRDHGCGMREAQVRRVGEPFTPPKSLVRAWALAPSWCEHSQNRLEGVWSTNRR